MPQKKRVPTYVASIKDSLDRRKKGKAFYDNAICTMNCEQVHSKADIIAI